MPSQHPGDRGAQSPRANGGPAVSRTPARHRKPPRSSSARPGVHARRHKRSPITSALPSKPAAPYLIYDSVIPSAIPAHDLVATYATGPFAVSPSQVAGRGPVLWIDVYGTDYEASALDVEPGDATPALAANWAWHRLSAHPDAIAHIYTALSEWPAVQAAVATLPAWMRARIRWWIAHPTGIPHIVPGSDATQWYC